MKKITSIIFSTILIFHIYSVKAQNYNQNIDNIVAECSYDTILQNLDEFEDLGIKEPGTTELENTLFWLEDKYASYGYSDFYRDTFTYAGHTLVNLVVTKQGSQFPDKNLIICGHYDTKNGPGVNDNGSGTAAILEIARLLEPLTSKYTVKFINFSGEEDGLLGSSHYVENVVNPSGMDIVLVFNIDAIGGVNGEDNSIIVCERDESSPSSNNDNSAAFTDSLATLVNLYSNLEAEISYAYGSDYVPFQENEYVITGFYNYVESPYYHTENDILANVDVDYIYETTKAAIGASLFFSKSFDPSVLVSENKVQNIEIYPNPISSSATLNVSPFMGNDITINIHDIAGKEVFTDHFRVISSIYPLNFDNQKSGFYLITIESDNNLFTEKIIVSKNK
ncbi:MAG: M28 family peptidase [Salinivirgaceae bacterium]|nr:M28 family peptidase [Salinivirgaceae bacterium]